MIGRNGGNGRNLFRTRKRDSSHQDFTRISSAGEMAKLRLRWLAELSTGFKRHQCGSGLCMQLRRMDGGAHRDRLRVTSRELPLEPGEPAEAATLPGCCSLVDALLASSTNCQTSRGILPPQSQSVYRWRRRASISPGRHRCQVDGYGVLPESTCQQIRLLAVVDVRLRLPSLRLGDGM